MIFVHVYGEQLYGMGQDFFVRLNRDENFLVADFRAKQRVIAGV
jgi:hypothetical protein